MNGQFLSGLNKKCLNNNIRLNKWLSNQKKDLIKPIKMAYKEFNAHNVKNNVPVIIMHGLFGSKTNWNKIGHELNKYTNRKIFTVDARNHGDSPHTETMTYYDMAEDIKLFMSDINTKKAALIGHSMGGRAFMAFSLLYQKYVESLTVVDISPVDRSEERMREFGKVFHAMKAVKFEENTSLAAARSSVSKQLILSLGKTELVNFLTMNIIEKSKGKFDWKVNVNALHKSYEKHLIKFPIKNIQFKEPTLFVIGELSSFVRVEDYDKIRELFPNTLFEMIPDCGHLVHAEEPEIFTEIVSNFINKTSSN